MSFHDVHMHIFNNLDVPMKTFLRRHGILASVFVRNWKMLSVDNRLRKFLRISSLRKEEILGHYLLELTEALSEFPRTKHEKRLVLSPLVVDFSKEDKYKDVEQQADSVSAR